MARTRLALPPAFSRGHFRTHARRMSLTLGGVEFGNLTPRENKTGSLGWRFDTKTQVTVGGVTVYAQVTATITVIDSSKLPK